MRILWFTNVPTPEMARHAGQGNEGYGGHWVAQLSNHVLKRGGIELGVATAYPGLRDTHFTEAGADYFVISQPSRYPAFGMRAMDMNKCVAVIDQFKPDLIHIHGSERFFGMVKAMRKTDVPVLLSVQGLLGSYSLARHFFGALSPIEILKSVRLIELPIRLGLVWQYIDAKRGAKREAKILSAVEAFAGRTEWDRAHTGRYNPDAGYHHVGEILRPVFYKSRWSLESCDRHTLIYTNAGHPSRGTENLLAAMAFLRKEFPDIRLKLAGTVSTRSGYGRFIRRRIDELGLGDRVEFFGYVDGERLAQELSRAHVFVISSYVENSANSLAEAMLVGMPCIAGFVGGIPSMVRDGETGLLYPVQDVLLLANKIRNIFRDDELAIRLGMSAHKVAHVRHAPETVVGQLIATYENILTIHRKSSNTPSATI